MTEPEPMPRRRGRASADNPPTPFDPVHVRLDPGAHDVDALRQVATRYYDDTSKSILSKNDSPDVGFTYSVNAYRGCEHGCIYCYARPSHAYLGWSAGLDFETRIVIKRQAPRLLAEAFAKPSWETQVVALSGNTDPYQPVERRLELTRGCLEVFLRHRNPVSVITKNHLVTRDLDVLAALAARNLVTVYVSVTTLQSDLVAVMEPRTSRPERRLAAMEALAQVGVPVGVLVAPVIPGLTDDELPMILTAAAGAGAVRAGYIMLRLPGAVESLFVDWLHSERPERAKKVVRRLREVRGGRLSDSRFGRRMRGEGVWADAVAELFRVTCKKVGLNAPTEPLSTAHFRRLPGGQLPLFGDA